MTKHTPGPWYPIRNVAYWEIRTANEPYEGQQIGDACASANLVGGDNGEANARVMAAAPKLLKHLRHMIWLVETELKADGGIFCRAQSLQWRPLKSKRGSALRCH